MKPMATHGCRTLAIGENIIKKHAWKRCLISLLALIMLIGLLPTAALAGAGDDAPPAAELEVPAGEVPEETAPAEGETEEEGGAGETPAEPSETPPAAEDGDEKDGRTPSRTEDRDSKYLSVVNPEAPVLTVEFYLPGAAEPFDVQNVLDGGSITAPDMGGKAPEGKQLQGFETETGAAFTAFGVAQSVAQSVTESATLRLTAVFEPIGAYVIYHDTDGSVIRRDRISDGFTFDAALPAFTVEPGYRNAAWNTKPDGSGTTYTTGSSPESTDADISVYPVLEKGCYVRFDSQGGTPVAYQFVLPGGSAVEPSAPIRDGHSFDGWYKGDAEYDFTAEVTEDITLTARWTAVETTYSVRLWLQQQDGGYKYHSSFTKTGISGSDAEFSAADQSRAEVTAATYSETTPKSFPVYFCDDKYGETALTMTNASIAEVNDNGGLAADGSSVINVYYRLLVYNFTLQSNDYPLSGGPYSYTFPVRSGENLVSAITRNNVAFNSDFLAVIQAGLELENYSFNIVFGRSNYGGDSYSNPSHITFYNGYGEVSSDYMQVAERIIKNQKGNYIFERRIYAETLESAIEGRETDFRNFSIDNFDLFFSSFPIRRSNTDGYIQGPSDGYDFYFLQIVDDAGHVKVAPYAYRGEFRTIYPQPFHTDFFMVRKSFTVDFDTLTTYLSTGSHTLAFGESLRDLDGLITYTDAEGEHEFVADETKYTDAALKTWIFKGWYDNPVFAGEPVDFAATEATMPASPVHYYAKWEPKQIKLTYDGGDGILWTGEPVAVLVLNNGDIPTRPDDPTPPEGMSFAGWTLNGKPYEFQDPLFEDETLVAVYMPNKDAFKVTYDAGAGSGTVPEDPGRYLKGATAKVLAPGADMTAPKGMYFNYWTDDSGNKYYPDNSVSITRDVTLTANYGKTRLTTLTYDPNGGSGTLTDLDGSISGSAAPVISGNAISNVAVNSRVLLSQGAGFTRSGFVLIGWNTDQQAASGGIVQYRLGARVRVDDDSDRRPSGSVLPDQPNANVLYAVWDELGRLTVSKTVAGNAGDRAKSFSFTVTLDDTAVSGTYGDMSFTNGVAVFTLKDGESRTAAALPNGVGYTVTEADYSADGYVTVKTGDTGSIVGKETKTAAFTNTKNTPSTPEYGSLTIRKTVKGELADKTRYFSFQIDFDDEGSYSYYGSASGTITSGGTVQLKYGESITVSGLPAGTVYYVTELNSANYTVRATDNSGTIAANVQSTASFTNIRSRFPATGDSSNLGLWSALAGLSLAGAFGVLLLERKKRRDEAR